MLFKFFGILTLIDSQIIDRCTGRYEGFTQQCAERKRYTEKAIYRGQHIRPFRVETH